MAHQRLQRPDQLSRLEDLRKVPKLEETEDPTDSPDEGSIEVDDDDDDLPPTKIQRRFSRSPSAASEDSKNSTDEEPAKLRSNLGNLKEHEQEQHNNNNSSNNNNNNNQVIEQKRNAGLSLKIRVEGTMDLSTKRNNNQDKENVGQDLTTTARRRDCEAVVEVGGDRESTTTRQRRDRSPKPRQVWRPY